MDDNASTPTAPVTPDEFASKIKAQYPQYAHVDNAVLTQKMLEKYPQYKDRVKSGDFTPPNEPGLEQQGPLEIAATAGQALESGAEASAEFMGRHGVPDKISAAINTPAAVFGSFNDTPGKVAMNLGGEALASGVAGAARVAKPLAEKMTPTFMELGGKAAQGFKKIGSTIIPLTAAEITQSPMYASIESALHNAPFSAGIIQRMQNMRTSAVAEYRNSLLQASGQKLETEAMGEAVKSSLMKNLAQQEEKRTAGLSSARNKVLQNKGEEMSPLQAGEQLQEHVSELQRAAQKEKNRLYGEAWKDLPPQLSLLDNKVLRAKAREILEKKGSSPSTIPSTLRTHLEEIVNGPQGISFDKLHDLQSDYGSTATALRKANGGMGTVESMIYDDLKTAARGGMGTRAKELGGDTWEKYELAKAFNRDEYKGKFADDVVRRFLKTKPDKVYDSFIKNGSIEDLRKLKGIAGDEAFKPLRRMFVEDIIGGANDAVPSSTQIAKRLSDYKYKMPELLTPAQVGQIERFAKTGELPQFVQSELQGKLASISQRNPQALVNTVLGGDTTISRAIKQTMRPADWEPFRRRFAEKLVGESGEEMLTSGKMLKNLRSLDPEYRRLFFSDGEMADIGRLSHVKGKLESGQRMWGNPSGTARALITWGQGAALLHDPASGAATVIAPAILAKMYLSPIGRRLLVDGINQTDRTGMANFIRMVNFMGNARQTILREEGLDKVRRP